MSALSASTFEVSGQVDVDGVAGHAGLGGGAGDLAGLELRLLDDSSLLVRLAQARREVDLAEARLVEVISEVDRRRLHVQQGAVSTTQLVAGVCGIPSGEAHGKVEMARILDRIPETWAALGDGDLSFSKVKLLARCAVAHPEFYSRDESVLVAAAKSNSASNFKRVIDYWRSIADGHRSDAEMVEASFLHASRTFGGMVVLDAELDPEAGEIVLAALDQAVQAQGAVWERPRGRRAEALTQICRHYLDSTHTGGRRTRPHISVIVDLDTLERRAGYRCETDRQGAISPETVRRLACDADITRIITGPDSQPLDVGRTTRIVSSAQRRALEVRDSHCQHPLCDRPAPWCDAHHIAHWIDGGETNLDNLVLLCRKHHTLTHDAGHPVNRPPPDDG